MISIIVAIDQHNGIGRQGQLLCHLPADLQYFKLTTQGKTVIMGERTYLSLPRHPLPNRRNIVLTDVKDKTFDGAETVYSIQQALQLTLPDEEAFIIGGGMVYRQFMPIADRLYITHIHHHWDDADTFFPDIDPQTWELYSLRQNQADDLNPYDYDFAVYTRRQQ